MGTRADFYLGRGPSAEWLGSIAWDGYPSGITVDREWRYGSPLEARTEEEFRLRLVDFFDGRDDVTLPADGWPWPWEDSNTSDYAYAFDDGAVWFTGNTGWLRADQPEPDTDNYLNASPPSHAFPNMKERMSVTLGPRSGLIVISQ